MFSKGQLLLIRHGATASGGRLCGRTDVELSEAGLDALAATGAQAPVAQIFCSPAMRCRRTADGLWPGAERHEDARLWEQDFGAWENRLYTDLPDVGVLSRAELADLTGDGGESFRDLCTRVTPVLEEAAEAARQGGPVAIVAHAGVVRAGLALALGRLEEAMAFEIDNLSVTTLRCFEGGLSIRAVNGAFP
ncbi:MAG: histidine phosphatase family protein [Silicimonas sp.]|nr:histidine phosphatase family protein [Silicimonas sp.]